SPGAGMMPKLVTGLMMLLGLVLIVRAGESAPFATIAWADLGHAVPVVLLTGLAIACYEYAGFIVTMATLMLVLLIGVERRHVLHVALFSIGLTAATYALFTKLLKSPLEKGFFGF